MAASAGPKRLERASSSSSSLELPYESQTRLSRSVDASASSERGNQDKVLPRLRHSAGTVREVSPPPGFTVANRARKRKRETPRSYSLKWQCPPKFALNPEWLVATGEESQEVGVQDMRLMGLLEAIYPRLSSTIPPDSSVSPDARCTCLDDADIPLVPITAIEDEEDLSGSSLNQHVTPGDISSCQTLPVAMLNQKLVIEKLQGDAALSIKHALEDVPEVGADVAVAASAAFIAMMISSNAGSLIDCNLLIEMLTNPRMMEILTAEYGSRKQESQAAACSESTPRPPVHLDPSEHASTVHSSSDACLSAHSVESLDLYLGAEESSLKKDADYCRDLIRQHGGEDIFRCGRSLVRQHGGGKPEKVNHAPDTGNEPSRKRDSKRKICTPCVYFNSRRGCRNGADCLFQHDVAFFPRNVGKKIKAEGRTAERR